MATPFPEGQDRAVPKPLDTALDVLVYLPVGLAVTAAEELPKLAAKGRARVDNQVNMARVVGQFAVAQGRKQIEKRWGPQVDPPGQPPRPPAASDAAEESDITYEDLVGGNGLGSYAQSRPDVEAPSSTELAIPGYDSLSASQVVERLAGLSEEELVEVESYELAHRARRTILNRTGQLQGR